MNDFYIKSNYFLDYFDPKKSKMVERNRNDNVFGRSCGEHVSSCSIHTTTEYQIDIDYYFGDINKKITKQCNFV